MYEAATTIAIGALEACHTKLDVPRDSRSVTQLTAVMNLGIMVIANLEGLLKAGMTTEERASMRAFLDQMSDRITQQLHKAMQTNPQPPETPAKDTTNG